MTTAPTTRASLLAGLRTGGVRSASGPLGNVPHTAALGGSFNIPRYASHHHHHSTPLVEEDDELGEMPSHIFPNGTSSRSMPKTAAVDSFGFSQQQKGLNPNSVPFSPAFGGNSHAQNSQLQALQVQMMQLEIMRLQNLQAQQYQAELLAQAQQQQQAQTRRTSLGFAAPATAGPTNGSFDLRSATQARRANQAEFLKAQLGINGGDEQVPMTAALGGKFGSRTTSANLPHLAKLALDEHEELATAPMAPASTTVISGGTSLGNPGSNGNAMSTPSKSDSAVSWRRGGNNNSVLGGNNRSLTSPRVKVTPPPEERVSPPPVERNSPSPPAPHVKTRPVPLRFNTAAAQMLPTVAIDRSPFESGESNSTRADDGYSTSSSKSMSSPTTPRSSSSNENMPLSPREEASKKLYEGLGIGRPAPAVIAIAEMQVPPPVTVVSHRMVSQPVRQPRGPPSGTDELAPQNFASRLRRKAIGGLSAALMSARERREVVEAY